MMAAFAHAGDFAARPPSGGAVGTAMSTARRGGLMAEANCLPTRRCDAVNPLALSLNENPFPPLPAVRSALIESVDVANRYPEFLPERLRR